jgi:hypothetical protein
MELKIHIDDQIKIEEINDLIKKGAKFISYQYIVSVPIFMPNRIFSKLYFIQPYEKSSKYAFKYNLISFLLGLWGLPFGPPVMIKTFILNLKGGVDLTEEVLINLKQDTLIKKEIILEKPAKYFLEPTKSSLKEFEKVFKSVKKFSSLPEPVIIGYYINTEKDEKPYHVIGISSEITDDKVKMIMKEIHKKFYDHIKFEIVNLLDKKYEHIDRLKIEGVKLNFEL